MEAAEALVKLKTCDRALSNRHSLDYKIALRVADLGADCLRINPGNIGSDDRVRAVVDAACHNGIPIRIGVNAGSLEKSC